jgi:hypothetical protein
MSNLPTERYAVLYWSDDDDFFHLAIVDFAELQRLRLKAHILNH